MALDPALKPSPAERIASRKLAKRDRAGVRQEKPRPDDVNTALTKGELAVVGSDQLRSLRNEERAARFAVEHRLGDLGHHLPREIRLNAGDQGGGDQRAGLYDGRCAGVPVGNVEAVVRCG